MVTNDAWLHAPGLSLYTARQSLSVAERQQMLAPLAATSDAARRIGLLRDQMFAGQAINTSENRAVGHWVYRHGLNTTNRGVSARIPHQFSPDGIDLFPAINASQQKAAALAGAIANGQQRSASKKPFRQVVHLGIGGSDLGPKLLIDALTAPKPRQDIQPFFLSGADYHAVERVLSQLDPHDTLVVVVSKSFTTQETMLNANHLKSWMLAAGIHEWQQNFVAITACVDRAKDWGLKDAQTLWFDQTIGGRFSLWGPVSFTARLILGNATIDAFLAGGAAMDQHFCDTPLARNMPAVLAAHDFYNLRSRKLPSLMISAYDTRLEMLVPYLQQLWMESLGKQVDLNGKPIEGPSCPILWGDVGTNAQHAFFQLLHQGLQGVAVDMVGVIQPDHTAMHSHQILLANFIAQSQALSNGQQSDDPTKTCTGGHPVNILLLDQLDAATLGSLIALWEHRVLCMAALVQVNAFDQWGVELGKQIAQSVLEVLEKNQLTAHQNQALHQSPNQTQPSSHSLDADSQAVINFVFSKTQ
jgi:glucose-6-phosphate isomerase